MIPASSALRQAAALPAWRQLLADAITDPAELLHAAGLSAEWLPGAQSAARLFPLRVPRGYAARMRRGDAHDPLLRQVLPLAREQEAVPGFVADPVGDAPARRAPGLLQKYHGRALLITTGACAVHCRYCFRRHYPYHEDALGTARFTEVMNWLRAHPEVDEIILSGGDPLSLSDARLADWARELADLPQLKRLRLHTRLPVVLPERVDDALLRWLSSCRLRPVMVIHANHAQELDASVAAALARLRAAGVSLLNQSVLLAGVNDSLSALEALSTRLFECGVLPYYLHLLDPVAGAAHFALSDSRARELHASLHACLPGYLVPRLVREDPGAAGKTLLAPGSNA
jgi:EF-P beta-lysylation protein EpmB